MQNSLTARSRFADLPVFSGKAFTLFVLFFTVVMEALIAEFGFPPSIRYINDFLILRRQGRWTRYLRYPAPSPYVFRKLVNQWR